MRVEELQAKSAESSVSIHISKSRNAIKTQYKIACINVFVLEAIQTLHLAMG
jgi:hypothetical protein